MTSRNEANDDHWVADDVLDCAVVGGGPAGLTAGLYLRRFHRSVRVIDAGDSRAQRIVCSHNYPGFPDGVAGGYLLQRMRQQLLQVGGDLICDTVQKIDRRPDGLFVLALVRGRLMARNVIFCTGVKDRLPTLPGIKLAEGADRLRYCPVCDGYEFTGKRIGVLGNSTHGIKEAAFLQHFSQDVWFIEVEGRLDDLVHDVDIAQLPRVPGVAKAVTVNYERSPAVTMKDGSCHVFDVLYAALGVDPRTQLAISLGIELDDTGTIVTDAHGRTSVSNLFAAGDVASGLDQLTVAVGQAAIAATAIHNSL
ncbi:MAG: NAD(P)/FAD-dependent oxidoreductase [Burkholderiaceae bacterium]|nr:NAD(P)/FAD-dependent oxidoreductase [Burkholderiaceae bacterium]